MVKFAFCIIHSVLSLSWAAHFVNIMKPTSGSWREWIKQLPKSWWKALVTAVINVDDAVDAFPEKCTAYMIIGVKAALAIYCIGPFYWIATNYNHSLSYPDWLAQPHVVSCVFALGFLLLCLYDCYALRRAYETNCLTVC